VANPAEFVLTIETPHPAEYCDLRRTAGLSTKTLAAAKKGLPNSLFAAAIRKEDVLIAMGRVVGDGGCNFEIVDIAVNPDYQRQGLGTQIMTAIMAYIRDNAPPSAYVSLIADHHSPALYKKFGFQTTTPKSIGMALRIEG
jgi:ribosomal protein S18 acetylase RimI-like enzyme